MSYPVYATVKISLASKNAIEEIRQHLQQADTEASKFETTDDGDLLIRLDAYGDVVFEFVDTVARIADEVLAVYQLDGGFMLSHALKGQPGIKYETDFGGSYDQAIWEVCDDPDRLLEVAAEVTRDLRGAAEKPLVEQLLAVIENDDLTTLDSIRRNNSHEATYSALREQASNDRTPLDTLLSLPADKQGQIYGWFHTTGAGEDLLAKSVTQRSFVTRLGKILEKLG